MKLHFDSKQVFQIEAVIVITNILCAVSMFLSSCNQDTQVSSKSIKVDVLLGFTGTGSQNAIETKAAIDICLQDAIEYFQRNSIDASLEVYYEDTQSDTTEAKIKAHFIETAGDYYGATGRTELDENGDRKHVYYDFWAVKNENGTYSWRLSAKYNTTDHVLKYSGD